MARHAAVVVLVVMALLMNVECISKQPTHTYAECRALTDNADTASSTDAKVAEARTECAQFYAAREHLDARLRAAGVAPSPNAVR